MTTAKSDVEVEKDNTYLVNGVAVHNCASHSISTAIEISHKLNDTKYKDTELSERYHWYYAREMEDKLPDNRGMMMRTMMKVLAPIACTSNPTNPAISPTERPRMRSSCCSRQVASPIRNSP